MREKGQTIMLLILVMTVALAIGLSIVQRSLVDVSTASKVEQSSRAFSAAEAGIEKALNSSGSLNCTNSDNPTTCQTFNDNSSSIKQISKSDQLPLTPAAGTRQDALEYPPLAKEEVAHVWLADPTSISNPPAEFYRPSDNKIEIYWGNSTDDKAAVEVKIIYYDGSTYKVIPKYFDSDSDRVSTNGFAATCEEVTPMKTTEGLNRKFTCKVPIDVPTGLMLVRLRLLYNSTSQPVAVRASGTCNTCSLPPQARIIDSTGVSGETQRRVRVFQLDKVVPPYFDYAIFSAGEISK